MTVRKKSSQRGGDVYSWGSGEMGQLKKKQQNRSSKPKFG